MHGTSLEPAPLDARRRKLLFRAHHRGTRENDLLVGGFVEARIATLTEAELDDLDTILEYPDPLMTDWLTGRAALPADVPALLTAMVRGLRA
jgi:antitoxin CptB